jgi:glycosyltransferase involved in cell wall biosynthesis
MRICHVIESTNAGSSRVVVDLARCGVAAGEDVTVLYSPCRAEKIFIDDLEALRPAIHLAETPMHREIGPLDLVEGFRLLLILRRLGPFDVIHCHSSKAGALARLAGYFLPGAIKVYAPHAFVTLSPNTSAAFGWIEKALSYFCEAIVVVSEQERAHAIDHLRIAPRLVRLIPNGVSACPDSSRAAVRERLGIGEDDFVVGFVGRMVDQKNPVRAVKAFARIATEHPKAVMVMVGDGPLEEAVRKAIRENGAEPRVRLVGYAPARDYMPAFDCLLCSSDYESFGLIFPEAMMAGVPVVSTNVGVVPELASSDGPMFAAAHLSPEALAGGLRKFLAAPPEARARLREEARACAKPYSVENMYSRTMALYRELCGKKAGVLRSEYAK